MVQAGGSQFKSQSPCKKLGMIKSKPIISAMLGWRGIRQEISEACWLPKRKHYNLERETGGEKERLKIQCLGR